MCTQAFNNEELGKSRNLGPTEFCITNSMWLIFARSLCQLSLRHNYIPPSTSYRAENGPNKSRSVPARKSMAKKHKKPLEPLD